MEPALWRAWSIGKTKKAKSKISGTSPHSPFRVHLSDSRHLVTHGTISSVTGHGPTCGMRMLHFLIVQASERRLKAARSPQSRVVRHARSEFLPPPPPP